MKTIRDWISCQLIPKSLLSARPLNFSNGDPPVETTQGTGTSVTSLMEHASANSLQSRNSDYGSNSSQNSQHATTQVACPPCSAAETGNSRDPLVKVEELLVNYLRLILRFNLPLENLVVAQVLHRLQLAGLIQSNESEIKRASLDIGRARHLAAEREKSTQADVDFSLKVLILGKTGVGKSSTINSIFDQNYTETNAFQPSTQTIREITGSVKGIKLTIIDTPGLTPSYTNQGRNRTILRAIKRFIKKSPPDLLLYVERLDLIQMGGSDFPLLKLITEVFGSSVWFNTILAMTHCSPVLPEGLDGYPVSYEYLVMRCTNLVRHHIHQLVSNTKLEIPVLLVENHHQCRRNREGEKILPSGEAWRRKFFLLCSSSKILADASKLLNFRDCILGSKLTSKSPSLPHLLSMLLHPRSRGSGGDENEFVEFLGIVEKNDNEYEKLPPIRILTKAEFQRLTKTQKNDYLDELEYRETLYLKKQWKEELRRREHARTSKKSSRRRDEEMDDASDSTPLPDMVIPMTFDPDYPVYRYRSVFYDIKHVVRPVLDSEGWDHDIGFDGINLESSVDINKNLNASVIGQMSKGKGEFNLQSESMLKYMDPKGPALSAGLDLQTSGKDLMYIVKGDAKLKSLKCNTAGFGLSLTSFRDMYLPGIKIDDMFKLGNGFFLHLNAGSLFGHGQVAHGGGLEATILGSDYPVRDDKLTVGTSLISFQKEMVLGGNFQLSFRPRRGSKISTNVNLNNRRMGQISIKISTCEHAEIALVAVVISIARAFFVLNRSCQV